MTEAAAPDRAAPGEGLGGEGLGTYALIAAVAGGLVALGAAMVIAAGIFAREEIDSQLRDWQTTLGVVAENASQSVSAWADRQRGELEALAGNETVRLFFLEWSLAGGEVGDIPDLQAQSDYLRNLLSVAAARGGFTAPPPPTEGLPANFDQPATAGLFLFDRNGRRIAASTRRPPAAAPEATASGTLRLRRLDDGTLRLIGRAPVYPLQTPKVDGREAGYIFGLKPVGTALSQLIQPPPLPEFSPRVALLQRRDGGVRTLLSSGTADPAPDVTRAVDTPGLAEGFAVSSPGGFGTYTDAAGTEVLVTARRVEGLSLTVMVSVPRAAALGPIERRYDRFQWVIWLFVGLVGAIIAVIWRHGASLRATQSMRRYREIAAKLAEQKDLLRIVTDSQPTAIFMIDGDDRYVFANAVCSGQLGVATQDLTGKHIDAVLGPAQAAPYRERGREAREGGRVVRDTLERTAGNGAPRIVTTEHVPLPEQSELAGAVLVTERDITAEVMERRRRERAQQKLIETLVSVVDRRDRHAANHSRRVGALAERLAGEMGLSAAQVGTARTAGILMNLGKILVPETTLQSERQSEDERAMVRAGIRATADLLADVDFDGPVLETLGQVQERVDGQGEPDGLAGDRILLTARLITVANALVSMLSPRGYRDALDIDTAANELVKQRGKAFDSAVVGAVLNFIENKGGRAFLESEIRAAK